MEIPPPSAEAGGFPLHRLTAPRGLLGFSPLERHFEIEVSLG
jgi:hypothetical protein